MSTSRDRLFRFGEFELDRGRRLLRRTDGRDVPLTPRVFDTLLLLVERAGTLVEKRELLDAVWPNVVVEENNLTQAISTLRRVLGEQPRQHRYIATVPGRGYRFVADVVTTRSPDTGPPVEQLSGERSARDAEGSTLRPKPEESTEAARRFAAYLAIAVVLAGATYAAFHLSTQTERNSARVSLTDLTLVSERRANHRQPNLSPDGSMLAFVGDESGSDQIYVQNVADGGPTQITNISGGAEHPAWSPRNDRIVFGSRGDGSIWTVGILGSPAPRMLIPEGKNPRFSFDGSTIVYEHKLEIRLADSSGERQRSVPGVPSRDWSFHSMFPALSADGREIVFFRQDAGPIGDYWVIPAAGGDSRQLTFDRSEAGRPAWASDGYIYFPSEREGTRSIWRIAAAGGTPESVTSSVGEDDDPDISRDARRIAYTNTRIETRFMIHDPDTDEAIEVYRSPLKSSFLKVSNDGRHVAFFRKSDPEEQLFVMQVGTWEPTQLTYATRGERRIMPRWSPDDRTIYFYQVTTGGRWSLQALPREGGPGSLVFDEFNWATSADVEWSPSGRQIVYVRHDPLDPSDPGRNRVVILNLGGGEESLPGWPIRFAPSWSPDGDHILGTSTDEVLVCPVGGETCEVVFAGLGANAGHEVPGGLGRFAQWSPDGDRIFFNRLAEQPGKLELWVVDRDGGNASMLFEYGPVDPLDGRFQVLSDDRILWNEEARSHYSELWVATLSRSDSGT